MMDDVRLALLGDKAAQERLTERGELLPCWRCGGEAEVQEVHTGGKPVYVVSCKKHYCGAYGGANQTKQHAMAYWNTRAPILTPEELEILNFGPCALCMYNPPSSMDGKPCVMCPAQRINMED